MTRELPQWLQDLLASPPRAGEGVHAWLFRVARQLHAHLPAVEIVALLEAKTALCGRHVSRKEITDAVQNALSCAWQPNAGTTTTKPASKWPTVNKECREAVIRDNGGLADLWELSNPRLEDNGVHVEEIVARLFPGNPLLCCGRADYDFDTKPRESWRGELADLQLIVPSPMAAVTGLTKDGKVSKHSLANTGPRRFVVCEFDGGTVDEQAGLLLHLATKGPLVLACHSGGKSLHGWFLTAGHSDDAVSKFFRYAVSLGADDATWTRSQFVRMPDGIRDTGKRQTVFYLNFQLLEAAR